MSFGDMDRGGRRGYGGAAASATGTGSTGGSRGFGGGYQSSGMSRDADSAYVQLCDGIQHSMMTFETHMRLLGELSRLLGTNKDTHEARGRMCVATNWQWTSRYWTNWQCY